MLQIFVWRKFVIPIVMKLYDCLMIKLKFLIYNKPNVKFDLAVEWWYFLLLHKKLSPHNKSAIKQVQLGQTLMNFYLACITA